MSASFNIRPIIETDAEAVAGLVTELGYPSTPEQIQARMREIDGASLLLVATMSAGRPVAFIEARRTCIIAVGSSVEIVALVVSSSARRSGLGRKLIAEVERWAKELGVERLVVRSNIKRSESHHFYPAMGYHLVKQQAVYEKRL